MDARELIPEAASNDHRGPEETPPILVVGDTHMSGYWWKRSIIPTAKLHGVKTIVQLGDFGWWPNWNEDYPEIVNNWLAELDCHCYFIDGNHENFDSLWSLKPGHGDMTPVGSHLTYVPRGTTWEWDGVRYLALGGAYSIDKERRTLGWDYFEQELIRHRDVERCLDAGPVDVMFTHDGPQRPPGLENGYKDDPFSAGNRKAVAGVVEALSPRLLFHGHYHHRATYMHGETRCEALGCDGDPQSEYLFYVESELATREAS